MISIVKQPYNYTPAANPVIFQLESDNSNIYSFQVEVLDKSTDALIHKNVYPVTPYYINGVYFNLSKILSNTVTHQVDNTQNLLIAAAPKSIQSYRLKITERIVSGSTLVNGAVYNSTGDSLNVWNAELGRVKFGNYNQDELVMNNNTPAYFLTGKPNLSNQSETSTEHLYFINPGVATDVRIRTYDYSGTTISGYTLPLPDTEMLRLSVGPKVLYNVFNIDFSPIGHYRVDLINTSGESVSNVRAYKFKGDKHYQEPVNVLWLNSLGGVDSYTFFNPREEINVTKTSIKRNIYKLSNGVYSDKSNGIYNPEQETLNVSSQSTYTVISNPLSDAESIWLKGLFESKQVWVELMNGDLVPVNLSNTNYQVALKKYNTGKINRLELSFTAQAGMIPSKAELTGSGDGSSLIQFNDLPINPVTDGDTLIYLNSSNGNINLN